MAHFDLAPPHAGSRETYTCFENMSLLSILSLVNKDLTHVSSNAGDVLGSVWSPLLKTISTSKIRSVYFCILLDLSV